MPFNPNTIWLSHTSLGDFDKCRKLYYLRNLYRDNSRGNNFRVQVANPYLSLGEAVHDAIDHFVTKYPVNERTKDNLFHEFNTGWNLKPGKRGGFKDPDQEAYFKERGEAMLERFFKNEAFSQGETMKVDFPKLPLIGTDDAILVGNFDWLEKTATGLHILDFKTGTSEEEGSIQLPIYALLAKHNLGLPVEKVSYWYLDRDDEPIEVPLVDLNEIHNHLKEKAQTVQKIVVEKAFECETDPCNIKDCNVYQAVKNNEAEYLYTDYKRKREVFYLQ